MSAVSVFEPNPVLSRPEQRRLLASTPPPTPWLVPHLSEDTALFRLMREGLVLRRWDDPTRISAVLAPEHQGAIRLFDRGIIRVGSYTDTHATWVWDGLNAEADGLRMLRHRTLGFLPYSLGYHGHTPATMSGPELVSMLVWHYRYQPVVRLNVVDTGFEVVVREHNGTRFEKERRFSGIPDIPNFRKWTGEINCHRDDPRQRFGRRVVDSLLTNLVDRVAPAEFGERQVTVDLGSWHLRKPGTGPESFTETLDLGVQDALYVLGAPTFVGMEDLVAWARHNLTVTVGCRAAGEVGRAGTRRHTVRLNLFTFGTESVHTGSVTQQEALESVHFLNALKGDLAGSRCLLVGQAWASDGVLGDEVNWSEVQKDRVLAAWLVAVWARETLNALV